MYILGINGTPNLVHENQFGFDEGNNHDSAAVLIRDGEVISTFEEERLNRIKHTNKWPTLAIEACLSSQNLTLHDIDRFAFPVSEGRMDKWLHEFYNSKDQPILTARNLIKKLLDDQFKADVDINKFDFHDHHYSHAVTAYYPSTFEDALVLTIDGVGGLFSGTVYSGNGNKLELIRTFSEEQSLGHFYNDVTNLIGFARNFDEYKVMGLAPYGNPATYRKLFDSFYELLPEGDYNLYLNRLKELTRFRFRDDKSGRYSQDQMDIAASLQEALEKIVFHILRHFHAITGHKQLCLAGGVALNCTMNGKIAASGMFTAMFVYPASNDTGLPVGSGLASYFASANATGGTQPKRHPLHSMYLGSQIGDDESIESRLTSWNSLISYRRSANVFEETAALLADNKVVGWVRGGSEFAPRALGNRSIIADSRPAQNKQRINYLIKKREGFRPFAPSVLSEYANEYFRLPELNGNFSHMTFVFGVNEKYSDLLGAITHVDGSARVQTVSKNSNPDYYKLIDHFRKLTGVPVILNTSFNNNAEPIVDSVDDAVVCFLTTKIDFLVIGDFIVSRNDIAIEEISRLYVTVPPFVKVCHGNDRHFLANTYNMQAVTITESIFGILNAADGSKSIGDLLAQECDANVDREEVLDDVVLLWEKRAIVLNPVSGVSETTRTRTSSVTISFT